MAKVPKKRSKVVKPKLNKPKFVKPTWTSKRKKSTNKSQKAEPHIINKFLIQSEDEEWWEDLDCTEPDQSPDHYVEQGWEIMNDVQLNWDKHPKAKRRVHLQFEDDSGNEPIISVTMG